jgi:hypothetical protein
VGSLYFVNTLGAAAGSFVAVVFLMGAVGQQGVVWTAVCCNLVVATTAMVVRRLEAKGR